MLIHALFQCESFNTAAKLTGGGYSPFTFVDVGDSQKINVLEHMPTIAMYSKKAQDSRQDSLETLDVESMLDAKPLLHAAHTRFANTELLVEAK